MTRYPINLQHGYFIRLLQEREHISYQNIQSNSNSVLDLTTNYSKRLVDNQHCLVIDQLAKKTGMDKILKHYVNCHILVK
ncbi:hypothetical protein SD457_25840 [Coprobacillaceae bacterium CR2/5/TPMF4]|nr:hypothetical protein SD457_25840 [Coprobacillaceae bacterium CR2/5/TPMF4]